MIDCCYTGVCKKTLLRKIMHIGQLISFQSTKSGAGEQFLLLGVMAKASVKGVFCSQTPVRLSIQ